MELHELIGVAIEEIRKSRETFDEKRNYQVDELILELSLSTIKTIDGKLKLEVFNFGGEIGNSATGEKTHKITLKLKPKTNYPHRSNNSR